MTAVVAPGPTRSAIPCSEFPAGVAHTPSAAVHLASTETETCRSRSVRIFFAALRSRSPSLPLQLRTGKGRAWTRPLPGNAAQAALPVPSGRR